MSAEGRLADYKEPDKPPKNAAEKKNNAPSIMDAMMEGADQPPFYPVMYEADIKVQSIATMTGSGTGRIPVAFDRTYLEVGFDDLRERPDQPAAPLVIVQGKEL